MYRQLHGYGNIDQSPYQLQVQNNDTDFDYAQFNGPMGGPMDPQLQDHSQNTLSATSMTVPASRPSHTRSVSHDATPRRPSASPRSHQARPSRSRLGFIPSDRSLPDRNITADTIAEAYVAFILYCNPKFGLDVDTSTLESGFLTPPKSDNKEFETFKLFELIKKFDAKEIKTWGQLALDLGVDAPDTSKGQSTQKVQQYSVRLKRWMRAMHVDAFFEYLLGKPHAYYQEIPPLDDPYPAAGRDGVSAEEDLAIRALDPSFRPKRGRRRNSEAEQEAEAEEAAGSFTSMTAAQSYPRSAFPASAYPSANMSFGTSSATDPWVTASAVTPNDFAPWMARLDAPQSALPTTNSSYMRWQNPMTPHPMTAVSGSMTAHIDAAFEPRSAVTPSMRKRRKHGPAVSSAWPSSNAAGSKPRGRPPASRNVQDGPFSTFPVEPTNDRNKTPTIGGLSTTTRKPATDGTSSTTGIVGSDRRQSDSQRPGRLSLQVPLHTGAPVRLATPPTVMVTTEIEDEQLVANNSISSTVYTEEPSQMIDRTASFESMKRKLANDLLRGHIAGRQHRLTGEEAKRLADTILERLEIPRRSDGPEDGLRLALAASWLGLDPPASVRAGHGVSYGKRITVTRIRIDEDGYEDIVSANDTESTVARETFDVSWTSTMGTCNGFFELKGLSLVDLPSKLPDIHDTILESWIETAKRLGVDDKRVDVARQHARSGEAVVVRGRAGDGGDIDWKARCQALEFGFRMAKGEFLRYRERLVEKVLDTII